ncbi:MAG TPA: hypothetical protein VIV11_03890, partial [Kofleriaceae bacterium]
MKLKELEKRLKNEPNNLGLRVQVAGMMREAGRSLEAVELYRSVALAYRDQGRTQQAIAVCRSILEIAPEDSACQGLIAMLQQRSTPVPSRTLTPSRVSAPVEQPRPRTEPTQPRPREPSQQHAAQPPRPPSQQHSSQQPPRESQPQAVMRGSPMPPAPDVPSLRPATAPTQRVTPPAGQRTPAVGQRPLTKPPPIAETSIPRPQQLIDKPMPRQPDVPVVRASDPSRARRPSERSSVPGRRSSMDETPLPSPVPYHLSDPTSQPNRISEGDIDDVTRPEQAPSGLVAAARRISGLISDSRGIPHEVDVSAELDTRQRRKIASAELDKIAQPPPTIPLERYDDIDDDLTTPPPPDAADLMSTEPQRALTPLPRGSEDALTPPSTRRSTPSLPRIEPSRTPSRPPGVISIPPKTQRPSVVSIPPKSTTATPSRPPSPSRPPPPPPRGLTPPQGVPLGKLRPPPIPPPRPAMP